MSEKKNRGAIFIFGKIISEFIFMAFFIFILVIAAVIFISNNENKEIFGYRFYNVISESMEPDIPKNSLIIVKVTNNEEQFLKGDDITFLPNLSDENTYLTHRIEEVIEADEGGTVEYVTKGVNNDSEDPWKISGENIIGKVTYTLPQFGFIISYIASHMLLIILIIALMLIFSYLLEFLTGVREFNFKKKIK